MLLTTKTTAVKTAVKKVPQRRGAEHSDMQTWQHNDMTNERTN